MRWYREFIASKYDGSARRDGRRSGTAASLQRLVVQFAAEKLDLGFLKRKASYQRDIEQRTIAAAVDTYLATEERRMTEGELRPTTLERVG